MNNAKGAGGTAEKRRAGAGQFPQKAKCLGHWRVNAKMPSCMSAVWPARYPKTADTRRGPLRVQCYFANRRSPLSGRARVAKSWIFLSIGSQARLSDDMNGWINWAPLRVPHFAIREMRVLWWAWVCMCTLTRAYAPSPHTRSHTGFCYLFNKKRTSKTLIMAPYSYENCLLDLLLVV